MEDNRKHSCVTRTFLICNVLKESGFIQEMNYLINYAPLCRQSLWLVSIHHLHTQNFHVTENGQWSGVNKKGNHTTHIRSFESKWKKKNTINNDDEIKLELIKITIIATTVAMKVIMGKIQSDNNNNDSTNKQRKSWSFSKRRRQQLQNINNSLCSNKAWLFILELNRFLGAKDIFHFCEDSNTLHQSEFNLDGLSSRMECGLKIGLYSVTWWT